MEMRNKELPTNLPEFILMNLLNSNYGLADCRQTLQRACTLTRFALIGGWPFRGGIRGLVESEETLLQDSFCLQ